MNHHDGKLSRRKLLAYLSVSSIAASVCGVARRTIAAQPSPEQSDLGARVYNIVDFGAVGDGATVNTIAVQKAIDTCANENGGAVLVPAGDFVTGTIELKSNVTLRLAAKGRLLGSPKIEHYKAGNHVPPGNGNIVMISAANAENIRIVCRAIAHASDEGSNARPLGLSWRPRDHTRSRDGCIGHGAGRVRDGKGVSQCVGGQIRICGRVGHRQ